MPHAPLPSRRSLLFAAAALPAASLFASCASTGGGRRPRTPGELEPTHDQMEGPFYRLMSPPRASLREAGMAGRSLELNGRVLDVRGKPLANTLIDVWHCDDAGVYDVRGHRLRGHLFTDAEGKYRLTTIVPGRYPGRTRHVHVKVQPAGSDVPDAPSMLNLTTQLYFPSETDNGKDELFDSALLMAVDTAGDGMVGRYDFVLDLA